jgi:S-adenosylmethionine decarboxylase
MINVKTSKTFSIEVDNTTVDQKETMNLDNTHQDIAGRHYIIDLFDAAHLTDIDLMEKALVDAANVAGATLLHIHLHKFTQAGGITGVALLAESHISVHTWPERNYAAFDVFMCGSAKPEKAVALLKQVFLPTRVEIKEILRGQL